MKSKKWFFGIGILLLLVALGVLAGSFLRIGAVDHQGIVLTQDEWAYTVHNPETGRFTAYVSTPKDPFAHNLYFGYVPADGDNVRVYHVYLVLRDGKLVKSATFVSHLADIKHVKPVLTYNMTVIPTDTCNGCDPTIIAIDCRGWYVQNFGVPPTYLARMNDSDGRWNYPFKSEFGVFSIYYPGHSGGSAHDTIILKPEECLVK